MKEHTKEYGAHWGVRASSCCSLAQHQRAHFQRSLSSCPSVFCSDKSENGEAYQRKKAVATDLPEGPEARVPSRGNLAAPGSSSSWRRIALLILAITIHNIPGEAVPSSGPASCLEAPSLSAQLPGWQGGGHSWCGGSANLSCLDGWRYLL